MANAALSLATRTDVVAVSARSRSVNKQNSVVFATALSSVKKSTPLQTKANIAAPVHAAKVAPPGIATSKVDQSNATASIVTGTISATRAKSAPAQAMKEISQEVKQFIEWQNSQPNAFGQGAAADLWKGDNTSEQRVAQAQAMIERENRRQALLSSYGMDTSQLFAWSKADVTSA
jgi:hypothetical protein